MHRCYGNNSRERDKREWRETQSLTQCLLLLHIIADMTFWYSVWVQTHPRIIITVQCLMQGTIVTVCACSKTLAHSAGAEHLREDRSSILSETPVHAGKIRTIYVIILSSRLNSKCLLKKHNFYTARRNAVATHLEYHLFCGTQAWIN